MTPHSRRRHPTSSATELDGPRRSLVSLVNDMVDDDVELLRDTLIKRSRSA